MDDVSVSKFEERHIALVGDRKRCRHFYLQFRSRLNIDYYFAIGVNSASDEPDLSVSERCEVICMPFSEKAIREKNVLLILCCGHSVREQYDNVLFNRGFEWGEDYIDYLYVIHSYQYKDHIVLSEKNLWIFGAGNNGRKFYEKYRSYYHIGGFISNYEEETEVESISVIRPTEILEQKNFFIVICSESEEVMSDQLLEMGLRGGETFGFADMLPKKLFVAVGTCQIVHTARVLYKNMSFSTQYNAGIYMDSVYQPCNVADNNRLKEYGSFCDVVFYNIANAGSYEQRSYEAIINKFYKNADKIYMPFYYFGGQLMQTTNVENKYMAELKREAFWLRGDKEINRMLDAGNSAEEILKKISKEDYWPKNEILNRFERELGKVAILDRFSSFPIKGFIEKNYKKIVIFDDGIHFSISLHLYLANEIARYLHIEPISDQRVFEKVKLLQKSTMPVYPCVRVALEMEIDDTYRFYNVEKGEADYLGFYEFTKKYIRYISNIKEVFEVSGTIFRY